MSNFRISLFFMFLLVAPLSFAAGELNSVEERSDRLSQMALGLGLGCAVGLVRDAIGTTIIGDSAERNALFDTLGILGWHCANIVVTEMLHEHVAPLLYAVITGKPKAESDITQNISRIVSGYGVLAYPALVSPGILLPRDLQSVREAESMRRFERDEWISQVRASSN